MKRFLSTLLCLAFLITAFSGCSKKSPTVRIVSVQNSASAFLSHMFEEKEEKPAYTYTLNPTSVPDSARLSITNAEADIAVLPVESAALLQKKASPKIKVIAGISVGGFELLATKSITDLSVLKGQTVYLTEPNTLMEYLLRYLVSLYKVDPFEEITFKYASDNLSLINKFSNNEASFALFTSSDAEFVKSNVDNLVSYNLTDEFAKKFKNPSIMNYCVIARSDFAQKNPKAIEQLLNDIKASVSKASDLKTTLALAKKHSLVTRDYYSEEFLKSCKADFICGEEMKRKLSAYYKLIYKVKPSLIGGELPDDEIFYISKK